MACEAGLTPCGSTKPLGCLGRAGMLTLNCQQCVNCFRSLGVGMVYHLVRNILTLTL